MKSLLKNKILLIYVIAIIFLIASATLGIFLGAAKIKIFDAFKAIFSGNTDTSEARILIYVRLPRVLAGIFCGMALSVSGAVIQGVLANKLASPSIIGVNSGAGLAVTICSAFGIIGGFKVSLFAFIGAFLTVMLVSIGAKKWGASRGTVILIGVALNALLGAISDTVITFVPEISIMRNDFRIGDFSSVTYRELLPASIIILISVLILITLACELDVLSLGDENAKGLGLNTGPIRVVFLLICAALASAAVSVCGLLSFVGLIIPHTVRRIATSKTKHLLILSSVLGSGFVVFCDTLARVIFAPYELPVGVIMAFLGAPFFVFILIKGKGGHSRA